MLCQDPVHEPALVGSVALLDLDHVHALDAALTRLALDHLDAFDVVAVQEACSAAARALAVEAAHGVGIHQPVAR